VKHRVWLLAALAATTLVTAGCSDDSSTGSGTEGGTIRVTDAWARSPMQDVGAVYFTVHNGASEEDRLTGVSTPVAERAEIHETVEVEGQMQMQPVGSVAVAPDQDVIFEPGGYHVMLFGLSEPLEVGSTIEVTLIFSHAGNITVQALVKEFVPEEGVGGGMTSPSSGMGGMDDQSSESEMG
jgi:periplasmic copper chaperone A